MHWKSALGLLSAMLIFIAIRTSSGQHPTPPLAEGARFTGVILEPLPAASANAPLPSLLPAADQASATSPPQHSFSPIQPAEIAPPLRRAGSEYAAPPQPASASSHVLTRESQEDAATNPDNLFEEFDGTMFALLQEEETQRDGRPQQRGEELQKPATTVPLGQEPQDITQIFLRQSSSLLAPGMVQWELGFSYLWQETDALVLLPGGLLDFQQIRDRRFLMPLTLRYGLKENVEIFGTLPVGVSHFERVDPLFRGETTRAGLGDVGAGFLYQWLRESADCPDVITSISFLAPTGADPFALSPNVAALGNGFWSVGGSVNVVRSFDPIVLFGGFGYRHEFGQAISGQTIQPGETFTYSCGIGFSVNDDIALSTELQGAFQTQTSVGGTRIPNSSSEPVSLQFGFTRRMKSSMSVQPFVSVGLTRDAPAFVLGFALIGTPHPPGEANWWGNRSHHCAGLLP